jgi:hypothetical protein
VLEFGCAIARLQLDDHHLEGRVDRHSGEILVEDPRCSGDGLNRQSRCRELCSAVAVELGKNCKTAPARRANVPRGQLKQGRRSMKMKRAGFDILVARYYPAICSFASRSTDDLQEPVMLTRGALNSTRKQLRYRRDQVALVTILLNAVIRAGFAARL